jgi:hypothetical protein
MGRLAVQMVTVLIEPATKHGIRLNVLVIFVGK